MGAILAVLAGLGLIILGWPKKALGTQAAGQGGTSTGTSEWRSIVIDCSKRYGVEEALIMAHIQVESSGNPEAVNPSDPSYGLMGITPILAEDFGYIPDHTRVIASDIEKIKRPSVNIECGTRFIAKLHSKYDFDTATQMYNCGEQGYKNGVRVPTYLSRVKRYYNEYRT